MKWNGPYVGEHIASIGEDGTVKIWQEDVDRRLKWGIHNGIKLGVIKKGASVVCVQGWRGGMGHTNTIRVVPAEDDLGLEQ